MVYLSTLKMVTWYGIYISQHVNHSGVDPSFRILYITPTPTRAFFSHLLATLFIYLFKYNLFSLMHKPEVKSLRTLIFRGRNVVDLFRRRHGVPDEIALLVLAHVVELGEVEDENVEGADGEQDLVSSAVYMRVSVSKMLCEARCFKEASFDIGWGGMGKGR